jgi:hypothetical protein
MGNAERETMIDQKEKVHDLGKKSGIHAETTIECPINPYNRGHVSTNIRNTYLHSPANFNPELQLLRQRPSSFYFSPLEPLRFLYYQPDYKVLHE